MLGVCGRMWGPDLIVPAGASSAVLAEALGMDDQQY